MNNNFDPHSQNQQENNAGDPAQNPQNSNSQNQDQFYSQNQQGAYSSNQQYAYGQNPYSNPPYNAYQQPNYADESGLFKENRMARTNGVSATIKLGDWLKADCILFLNLVPCFGSIAAIILYLVLAFSANTAKSLKTRYQAALIWSAIALALYVVLFVILIALGFSLADATQNAADGFY